MQEPHGTSPFGRFPWLANAGERWRARAGDIDLPSLRDQIEARSESEPLPASSGSGVDGHLLMRWNEWAEALWKRYGDVLLRREDEVRVWAEDSNYDEPELTAVSLLNHVPNRHAMFADMPPAPSFPYPRNRVSIPMSRSGRLDVQVADYNRYRYWLQNKKPMLRLQATSLALSPFPSSSSMIITPHSEDGPVPVWEAVAGPVIKRGHRRFDTNYTVYAREEKWARETLTKEIVQWLLSINNIRIIADRDSLLCIFLPGWCPTEDLDELADVAATVSRSAREAVPALSRKSARGRR